jgi:hypothetical protein
MCITLMYFRYHRFLCYRLSRIQAFSGICLVITLHYPNRYGTIFRVELSLFSAAITIALSSLAMDSSSLGTPPSLSVASSFAPSDPLSVHQHFLPHHHFIPPIPNQFLLLLVMVVRIDCPLLIL